MHFQKLAYIKQQRSECGKSEMDATTTTPRVSNIQRQRRTLAAIICALAMVVMPHITIVSVEAQQCTTISYYGANAMQCDFIQGARRVQIGESFQWAPPSGINSINVTLWGAGGGGSATTLITSTATGEDNGVFATGYSAGGGSGSAIVNYPVSWTPGQTQTITMNIGVGGAGGTCSSINGGQGGQTTVAIGSLVTLTAYGGGGGGATGDAVGDGRGGGGGGSGGPGYSGGASGGNAGQGGPACTSSANCPGVGPGPSGGTSNVQKAISFSDTLNSGTPTCSSSAGVYQTPYWVSGGAGTICDVYYIGSTTPSYLGPLSCSTENWPGPCYSTTGECDGSDSGSGTVIQVTTGTVVTDQVEVCYGNGAPGIFGNDSLTNSSGAGGSGCDVPAYQLTDNYNDVACPSITGGCVGVQGGAGGVIITFMIPSRTFMFLKKKIIMTYLPLSASQPARVLVKRHRHRNRHRNRRRLQCHRRLQ